MLSKGFSLLELLVAVAILANCLTAILLTYMNMYVFSDAARDLTLANNALQTKMEELKNTSFANLSALNGTTFDISGFSNSDAKGLISVSNTAYSDLKEIRIAASFKSRGRLIGEDKNLNGSLDSGEDLNNNNRLDSPAELATLIAE
jgi:prepilin-type N-terminal cleavage/methylation domain-containing protein